VKIQIYLLVVIKVMMASCQTSRIVPVSQRSVGGLEKFTGDSMVGMRRSPNSEAGSPEVFVKREEIRVEPLDERNTTGSLFVLDDERNYLFISNPPVTPGRYINVQVTSHRVPRKSNPLMEKDQDEPLELDDEVAAEILASLPHLGPRDEENRLLSSLRMRVEKVYPNGDVRLSMQRRSQRDNFANAIDIRARLAYDRLTAGSTVSTNDLADVHWYESQEGQTTERYSSLWEDEFTARLSGFEEAMSQHALELARKERQMQEARERMQNRLKALGAERKSLAREREQVQQMRNTSEERVNELERQVRDREEELNRIRPLEDKPGDERDGAAGR